MLTVTTALSVSVPGLRSSSLAVALMVRDFCWPVWPLTTAEKEQP